MKSKRNKDGTEVNNPPVLRDANVDLLRVIATFFVIVLHINFVPGSVDTGLLRAVEVGSINSIIGFIFQVVCNNAVNIFILITGYYMVNTKYVSLKKPLLLLIQVIAFSEITYLLEILIGRVPFSIKYMIGYLVPRNYYVTLYIVLLFFIPFINKMLSSLKTQTRHVLIALSVCFFSIEPMIAQGIEKISGVEMGGVNTFGIEGNQAGYTAVHFIMMYMIGYEIRKTIQEGRWLSLFDNNIIIIGTMVLCLLCTFWSYYGFAKMKNVSVFHYSNPLYILFAIYIFAFFIKLKVKNNKFLDLIAANSFSVYLAHSFFLHFFDFNIIAQYSAIYMILAVMGISIIAYAGSTCLSIVYDCTIKRLIISTQLFKKFANIKIQVD